MPNRDGTGPRYVGHGFGRGFGMRQRYFSNYVSENNENLSELSGMGRGFGRGMGLCGYSTSTKIDEKSILEARLKNIDSQKKTIEERLKNI